MMNQTKRKKGTSMETTYSVEDCFEQAALEIVTRMPFTPMADPDVSRMSGAVLAQWLEAFGEEGTRTALAGAWLYTRMELATGGANPSGIIGLATLMNLYAELFDVG